MKKNDRDNFLPILPSPNLKCSRLTVHLSVFIFQLLFQRPESLLQTLLFFQQWVSLGTKHLQSESNVKPMHGPEHQRQQTLLQTHLLCATRLLRGCGKLFFQLADLLKQLPVLGFLLVQLALNTKSLFLKPKPKRKFKQIPHNNIYRKVHFRRSASKNINFSNQFKWSTFYENNRHKFWTVRQGIYYIT